MGAQKKKTNMPSKDANLENILKKLRNDIEAADELVEYLESGSFNIDKHDIKFCKAYTIALIQTYCKGKTKLEAENSGGVAGRAEDKIEFMLVTYGLLEGFEFKSGCLSVRMHDYYAHAHGYNSLIKGVWNGGSIDKMTRDISDDIERELANTLYDLTIQNNGNLGFLDKVPKELNLPTPRGKDMPRNLPPSKSPSLIKKLVHPLRGIKSGHLDLSKCVTTILGFVITALLIKLAFFPTVPYSVPEIVDHPSITSVPVEKIISEKSPFIVYPGLTILLPLDISPDEAAGTFLYCSSSDSNILYTEDGDKPWVKALEISNPNVSTVEVIVTVTPQNRASSDVFVEVPVIVDYRNTVPEPFN